STNSCPKAKGSIGLENSRLQGWGNLSSGGLECNEKGRAVRPARWRGSRGVLVSARIVLFQDFCRLANQVDIDAQVQNPDEGQQRIRPGFLLQSRRQKADNDDAEKVQTIQNVVHEAFQRVGPRNESHETPETADPQQCLAQS